MALDGQAPTGTITMVFTDIEDSSAVVERLGAAYPPVLAMHHTMLRTAFREHGGYEVSVAGDGFFVTFTSANAAVSACLAAQEALSSHPWPEPGIRVRMGLHTGEVAVDNGEYVGVAVHQAARVGSAAHGGQILASGGTVAVVGATPVPDLTWRDLGHHRVKGLTETMQLFQACRPGLRDAFPPPSTMTSSPGNLPESVTSLVGRGAELAELEKLLSSHRLVSIIGVGGAGKTRLAVEAARRVSEKFSGGAWIAPLASISESALVPSALVEAVGLSPRPGDELEAFIKWAKGSPRLVVLDNVEHLAEGARYVATRLLAACPEMVLLVTGRRALNAPGEFCWDVPALPTSRDSAASIAAQLFTARAAEAGGAAAASLDIATVERLCSRLDGHALSIELAAAQLRTRSLAEVEELVTGQGWVDAVGRTSDPRHSTIRAVFDSSYALLDEEQQRLLRSLSVFAGPFRLESAQGVAAHEAFPASAVPAALAELVAASLVRRTVEDGVSRYSLQEVIRQAAHDRLVETGEIDEITNRHQQWFSRAAGIDADREFPSDARDWFDDAEIDRATRQVRAIRRRAIRSGVVAAASIVATGTACLTAGATRAQTAAVVCGGVLVWALAWARIRAKRAGFGNAGAGFAYLSGAAVRLGLPWIALAAGAVALSSRPWTFLWFALILIPVNPRAAPGRRRVANDPELVNLVDATVRSAGLGNVQVTVATFDAERSSHLAEIMSMPGEIDGEPARVLSAHLSVRLLGHGAPAVRWVALHALAHPQLGHSNWTVSFGFGLRRFALMLFAALSTVIPVPYLRSNHALAAALVLFYNHSRVVRWPRNRRREEREADLYALARTREISGIDAVLREQALASPEHVVPGLWRRTVSFSPPIAERLAIVSAWESAQRNA